MELRDYFQLIRRRWKLIAACLLLTVAAAALITLRATPQYAATARLFVSTPQSSTSDAYQGGLFSQQRVASYADLITGENLAQRVIDRLNLQESSADLAEQVSSSVSPETVILEVTVTDPSPQRAHVLARAMAQEFTQFVQELETAPGKKVSPIKATIVDSPERPTTPVSPQPIRNLGLAAVIGLLLGVGLAVLRETLDRTIKSPQDLSDATGTSLLGTVQYDARAAKSPLVTELESHAPRVEAFRMLRTNLQFVDVDKRSKVFVVTSAVPAEGKSTTAINLAVTLAQASQRVLLVEGDLRRPRISTYLRLEPTVGLTTVLIGRVGVEEAIQPWGKDGLDVMTSGTVPPNPAELLQSQAMESVISKVCEAYDVIVIDAPPLLPVTDAALLAAQSDGAILVVRHGKTTREQASLAAERLHSVDAKILGTVLNMTPDKGVDRYNYGYGYGYGYAPTPPPRQNRRARKRQPKTDEELDA